MRQGRLGRMRRVVWNNLIPPPSAGTNQHRALLARAGWDAAVTGLVLQKCELSLVPTQRAHVPPLKPKSLLRRSYLGCQERSPIPRESCLLSPPWFLPIPLKSPKPSRCRVSHLQRLLPQHDLPRALPGPDARGFTPAPRGVHTIAPPGPDPGTEEGGKYCKCLHPP